MFSGIVRALTVLTLAAGAAADAKIYEAIKGESALSYGLVHPMHHITGVSRDFLCKVDLSPDTLSSQIKVIAAISSFDSKNSSRDSHAMEMVQAMKYPNVEFASTAVKPEGDGYLVSGNLTFHGITRPVAFHVTPKSGGGKVEIIGEFAVKLSDFKVERPSLLFVPTEDKLTIRFDLFSKS
jgi:polyisoprenoid-binding protein YceI